MNLALLATALTVGYSIVTLWRVSMLWRADGEFLLYLPFFLYGVFVNALGAFIFYGMLFTFWWFILDFTFFVCYALLLATLVRIIQKLP